MAQACSSKEAAQMKGPGHHSHVGCGLQEIDDLSGGAVPMRVVCTGYGIGAPSGFHIPWRICSPMLSNKSASYDLETVPFTCYQISWNPLQHVA